MVSINKTKMTDTQICELGATLALLYDTDMFMCTMRPHNKFTLFLLPKI